jgi:hypothetical protein
MDSVKVYLAITVGDHENDTFHGVFSTPEKAMEVFPERRVPVTWVEHEFDGRKEWWGTGNPYTEDEVREIELDEVIQ